jgi:hypothetical protein
MILRGYADKNEDIRFLKTIYFYAQNTYSTLSGSWNKQGKLFLLIFNPFGVVRNKKIVIINKTNGFNPRILIS